jgi:hypothetical protein
LRTVSRRRLYLLATSDGLSPAINAASAFAFISYGWALPLLTGSPALLSFRDSHQRISCD